MRCPVRPLSLLLVGLTAAALGFAPAPVYRGDDLDPAKVLKRLEGTWAMPRYEQAGRTRIAAGEAYTIKIEKDQWTFFRSQKGGRLTKAQSYTLKLDPKATPPEVELVRSKTYLLLGAYELKGDTLKIVFRVTNDAKRERARDLTNLATGDYLIELQRKP